jgi:hypothetical protein
MDAGVFIRTIKCTTWNMLTVKIHNPFPNIVFDAAQVAEKKLPVRVAK